MASENLFKRNLADGSHAWARPMLCALAVLLSAGAAEPPQVPRSSGLTIVDAVRFFPAPKREKLMVGGRFAGSNVSPTEGFHVMAEITAEPKAGEWTELHFENKSPYRWVRYEAPPGSRGNIGEIEFHTGSRK